MKCNRLIPLGITLALVCGPASGCGATHMGTLPTVSPVPTPQAGRHLYVLGNVLSALESTTGRVIWTQPYRSDTVAQLVVTSQAVYLAADHLEAFRATDGTVLWQSPLVTIGATLAFADTSRVYVLVRQQVLAFRASDGHELWTTLADDQQAPILAPDDATLYVPTSNQIHAVDVQTGSVRWVTTAAALGASAPPVAEGALLITLTNDPTNTQSQVVAYHETDGSVAWHTRAAIGPFIAHDAHHVYAVAENVQAQTDQFLAIDVATGAEVWTLTYPYAVDTQVVEQSNTLYISEGQGSLVAVDGATGHQLWQQQQQQNVLQLLVSGSHGYVSWDGGAVTAFTTTHGATIWVIPQLARLAAATPDALYALANNQLSDLSATTGNPRWQTPIATTLTGTVQVALAP